MYSKDASQAIRSCYAQLRCWLMYDGVRIKGGSRYQICEELSRKYSSEMADQYRKVTRLAEKAAYSSHAMEEKQAEEYSSKEAVGTSLGDLLKGLKL